MKDVLGKMGSPKAYSDKVLYKMLKKKENGEPVKEEAKEIVDKIVETD